jgi:hypothetical protein
LRDRIGYGHNTLTGNDRIGTAATHTNGLYTGWRCTRGISYPIHISQGYDCSLATCPLGDDPLTTGQTDEVRTRAHTHTHTHTHIHTHTHTQTHTHTPASRHRQVDTGKRWAKEADGKGGCVFVRTRH